MDRNRFKVAQTTLQVVSELSMVRAQRHNLGEQFTVSLAVADGERHHLWFDIYVDRLPDGQNGIVFVSEVSGLRLLKSKASISPDGEKFDIEIILDKSKDLSQVRPEIGVPPEMFRQVRAMLDEQFVQETLDIFNEDHDQL